MKKNRFLLLAGTLGFLLVGASCFKMGNTGGMGRAEGIALNEAIHEEGLIEVQEPHFEEEAPTSEKKTATPARQWEDKDTGFVVFGVLMGATVALVATMVTLSILKKKKGEQKEEAQ